MEPEKYLEADCPACGSAENRVNPEWLRWARDTARQNGRPITDRALAAALGYQSPTSVRDYEEGRLRRFPKEKLHVYEQLLESVGET